MKMAQPGQNLAHRCYLFLKLLRQLAATFPSASISLHSKSETDHRRHNTRVANKWASICPSALCFYRYFILRSGTCIFRTSAKAKDRSLQCLGKAHDVGTRSFDVSAHLEKRLNYWQNKISEPRNLLSRWVTLLRLRANWTPKCASKFTHVLA